MIVFCSFAERLAVKITDYTGCLHLRHPKEMGGAVLCLSMLWAQVSKGVGCGEYRDMAGRKTSVF